MKPKALNPKLLCAFLVLLFCFEISSEEVQKTKKVVSYKPLDIEGSERNEVLPYREKYQKLHEVKWLSNVLDEAESYRLYVRKRLKEENMPSCLEYLPIIESSYKPTAKPTGGKSMGIWQFMPNSVAPYLVLNEWVDERRDPWKSTDAALAKLKSNYEQFGDWPLALAAYNCGAGAVSRALQKTTEKTYWSLCEKKLIPQHAIRYVPNFLAAADTIQNAEYYELDLISKVNDSPNKDNPYFASFDYVTVNDSISLARLAAEMRLDYNTLERLNLSLLKGETPPNTEYTLRLPLGMKRSAEDAIYCILKEKNYR